MAATVKSVSTTAYGSGTSITVTKPTGLTVGDLMIFHYAINDATDTISTKSGWTHEIDNASIGNLKTGLQWKIADSSDVSASDFTFNSTGTSIQGGAILRIDGHVVSNLLNDNTNSQPNTSTPTYTDTVTPTAANSLLLFFVAANENGSVSSYSIATDNPTWTEQYDFGAAGNLMACASASRPELTATGSSSATVGSGSTIDSRGILVAIDSVVSVTVSPTVTTATLSVPTPSVSGTASVSAGVASATFSCPSPTVSTSQPDWTNTDKSTTTWTNTPKS